MTTYPNVKIRYLNEIPFGPAYYGVYINYKKIKGVFGRVGEFSEDKRYIALEEWAGGKFSSNRIGCDFSNGRNKRLFLIDLDKMQYCTFDTNHSSVQNLRFESHTLLYTCHRQDIKINIKDITSWDGAVKFDMSK